MAQRYTHTHHFYPNSKHTAGKKRLNLESNHFFIFLKLPPISTSSASSSIDLFTRFTANPPAPGPDWSGASFKTSSVASEVSFPENSWHPQRNSSRCRLSLRPSNRWYLLHPGTSVKWYWSDIKGGGVEISGNRIPKTWKTDRGIRLGCVPGPPSMYSMRVGWLYICICGTRRMAVFPDLNQGRTWWYVAQ